MIWGGYISVGSFSTTLLNTPTRSSSPTRADAIWARFSITVVFLVLFFWRGDTRPNLKLWLCLMDDRGQTKPVVQHHTLRVEHAEKIRTRKQACLSVSPRVCYSSTSLHGEVVCRERARQVSEEKGEQRLFVMPLSLSEEVHPEKATRVVSGQI